MYGTVTVRCHHLKILPVLDEGLREHDSQEGSRSSEYANVFFCP